MKVNNPNKLVRLKRLKKEFDEWYIHSYRRSAQIPEQFYELFSYESK